MPRPCQAAGARGCRLAAGDKQMRCAVELQHLDQRPRIFHRLFEGVIQRPGGILWHQSGILRGDRGTGLPPRGDAIRPAPVDDHLAVRATHNQVGVSVAFQVVRGQVLARDLQVNVSLALEGQDSLVEDAH